MNTKQGVSYQYELRDARTNDYLGDMGAWFSNKKNNGYIEGDTIQLKECMVEKTNSQRLMVCIVDALRIRENGTRVLYLDPTKEEYKPFGRVIFRNLKKRKSVDWTGLDGWLNLNSK